MKWEGFTCCLDYKHTHDREKVLIALDSTYDEIINYLTNNNDLKEVSINFLLDLLEHEVQHHGQLIRYIYGNKIAMP